MQKKLIEIASEIVQSQVSLTPMSATDIATSLREVFRTLQMMQTAESAGSDLPPTLPIDENTIQPEGKPTLTPAESIQNDKVICLECGAEMRQLTQKHLANHGMNAKEYRQKYGFTMRTPLSAKSLTKARSKAAKKRGLPENLTKFLAERRALKAAAKSASEPSSPVVTTETKPKRARLRTKKV